MESDSPAMKPTINRFVIRESLKELQARRTFASLDELSEAVIADLGAEGFRLDSHEQDKVKSVVREEGYTGRFVMDDVLRRKLKNKKLVPVLSVALAVLAFFVTTSIAAVIEHFVQKPLETDRAGAPLVALFQVPEKTGDLLSFKVKLSNVAGAPLSKVVVFASAGEVTRQFQVEPLEPGQTRTVAGALDLSGSPEGETNFVAYVISGDFSLCSEPTTVAYQSRQVAMAPSLEGAGPSAESSAKRGRAFHPAVKMEQDSSASGAPAPQAARAPRAPRPPEAEHAPVASAEVAIGSNLQATPSSLRTIGHRSVSSKAEVERLARATDPISRGLLEAYAAAGDPLAQKLLAGKQ